MKIYCPSCGQDYDIEPDQLGKNAECEACKENFTLKNPNLITCPICFKDIAKTAEGCIHCGHVLIAKKEIAKEIIIKDNSIPQAHSNKKNEVVTIQLTNKSLKAHLIISVSIIIIGVLFLFGGKPEFIALGLLLILVGIIYKIVARIAIWWQHK